VSRAAVRVRCYNCGRVGPRDAAQCPRCAATYAALCNCGAELSVFDDECVRCGAPHVPKRVPAAKHPWVRASKWTALAAAVGVACWVAFGPREVKPYELKRRAKDAYNASDYATAARLARDVTEQAPADAEGWYLLAECHRALKFPPSEYMAPAEHAVKLQDDCFPARELLARAEMELRHVDRAIEHAEKATRSPNVTAGAWLLLARLELLRPRPNLAAASRALERARAAGRDTADVKALLAEITIRMNGARAGGADRLPPGAAATLRAALPGLEARTPTASEAVAVSLAKARIHLALGEAEKAIADADRALVQLDQAVRDGVPEVPSRASAEVKLVRAMALHMRGNAVEAMNEFHAALGEAPDAAAAAAASDYLVSAGDAAAARALLAGAAEAGDPHGGIRAVLAALLLSQGAVDDAARSVESAAPAAGDDAFFAEIVGSIRIAQGRWADARAAFDAAAKSAPGLAEPWVRRALVTLAESAGAPSADATRAGCERALAELRALQRDRPEFASDPLLLEGIGRVSLALGDPAAARAALESAADAWPADPDVWIALAEARRRSGDAGGGDALAAAAAALDRARLLRRDDAALALAAAAMWSDAGRYEVAVSTCTDFLRAHPDAAALLRARAACYLQLEMWSLAAADLRRVRELGAADAADLGALVDALYRAGDQKAAALAAEDAKDKVPAHVLAFLAALHGGDPNAAIAHLCEGGPSLLLAEVQLAAGRESDSTETLRRLAKEHPGDAQAARLLVAELLGPEPASAERIAEARALLAGLSPASPPGVARLIEGRILLAEGDRDRAVPALREAARALPDDPLAALFLGDALFRGGERTESLALLRRAAALPGVQDAVRSCVANRLLVASGYDDLERAEALAREAWRLDARCVAAAYRIMDVLHGRADFAQAADVAEIALRSCDPGSADAAKLRLAAAFEHLLAGEFPAAQVHVDALPAALRDGPTGRLLTGFAELGAGRTDAARAVFATVPADGEGGRIAAVGLLRCDLARGDRAAAAALVDAWCAARADDRDVSMAASRLFQKAGHGDDAVRFAALCAARHPADLAVALNHATVLRRAGRPAEAVAALRRFADAGPAADPVALRLATATLSVQCGTGVEEALEEARRLAADPALAETARIEASVIAAEALVALGHPGDGESAARAALEKLGDVPAGGRSRRILEARARFVAGCAAATAVPPRRKQALDEFVQCLALDRENLDIANDVAWVMAEDGDRETTQRALDLARKVTAEAPGDAGYWDTRAAAARRAGEFDEAESSWTRSLDLFAASARRDPAREMRTALRCARFLRDERKKPDAARQVVERIRPLVARTSAEREIDAFLAAPQ
jgi:predicted Zn-dependent protease